MSAVVVWLSGVVLWVCICARYGSIRRERRYLDKLHADAVAHLAAAKWHHLNAKDLYDRARYLVGGLGGWGNG